MDEICDKIAVLHNSKIRFHGTPDQLKNQNSANNLDQAFLIEINKY
jgi:ABC-type Na+ transport system ATPase subunit NatA